MNGINNSQIQQVIQLIARVIYINDKIPIHNIPEVTLVANFWLKFFLFIVISVVWIIILPIDKTTNPIIRTIIIFLPITVTFLLTIKIIEKKHILEINENHIKYKEQVYPLDDIFNIFQHPIFKSKVTIYYIRRKDN